ncbi:MAG: hypothetical protein Q9M91_06020 [Candidatus Dojkabacteria bacterium]|nr:hypothetical protein [Candidatus Dojkabacteria bacterium]
MSRPLLEAYNSTYGIKGGVNSHGEFIWAVAESGTNHQDILDAHFEGMKFPIRVEIRIISGLDGFPIMRDISISASKNINSFADWQSIEDMIDVIANKIHILGTLDSEIETKCSSYW